MDNSVYIMLSRQTALFRQMDMTANNMANVDTGGFQAEKMTFSEFQADVGNNRKMSFTQDRGSYLVTQEGSLQQTNGALDVAVNGPGYFAVETPRGTRYTRNGAFQLDQDGNLTTSNGSYVLDEAGQHIQFEPGAKNVTIGESGNIAVDGQQTSTLGVFEFPERQKLEHESGSTFRYDGTPVAAIKSRVAQGVIEKSNVDPVRELVDMTEIQRGAANTAKFIETIYDLQQKANSAYAQAGNS